MSFSDILKNEPSLLQSLQAVGFSNPTPAQTACLPLAMDGKDIILQARTGSGKTLAYLIPLLARLNSSEKKNDLNRTFGLVISPTRELAVQIKEALLNLDNTLSPCTLIGGMSADHQIAELRRDARIVIGTPGRILDLLRKRDLHLKYCQYFVLDEADEVLSMGFLEDVRAILSRLPDRRQGLFISATVTPRVEMLARNFLYKPEAVYVDIANEDLPLIEHLYSEIGGELMAKPAALCDILETMRPRSAIIFCNTKSDTQLVEALLRRRGFDARRINSDLSQAQRNRIMEKIRKEDLQYLVATDIAARGIDLDQIDLVINYNIHEQPEIYLHRTGRTGRAGRSGKALSLVGPRDFGAFHFLRKVVKADFKKLPLPTDEEVADARLTHLYEIVRLSQVEVRERDLLVAKKFLKESCAVDDADDELKALVAKLCKHTAEHFLKLETKALEDELLEECRPNEEDESEIPDDRSKFRDSLQSEKHKGRRESSSTRGSKRKDRNYADFSEHSRDRKYQDGSHVPRHSRESQKEESKIRLYLGQGSKEGIDEKAFKCLAVELGGIKASDLENLVVREHFGFLDVSERAANLLLGNINNIEYKGVQINLERATEIKPPKTRDYKRQRQERNRRPRTNNY